MSADFISVDGFQNIDRLVHGFTTRRGGVSQGPFASLNFGWGTQDDDIIGENYGLLAQTLDMDVESIVGVNQVHGHDILHIAEGFDLDACWSVNADGMITQRKNIVLTIRTADCYPLLFVDPIESVIATVHAGWRGTLDNISGLCVEKMVELYNCQTKDIRVAIGPGISMSHFEVSSGVFMLFHSKLSLGHEHAFKQNEKYYLDLEQINRTQLIHAKIEQQNIVCAKRCTYSQVSDFYSYRRDGQQTGRQLAFIAWRA